ncbi:MAG: fibro-slime domain-containing protein [Phycisphaeraceae bacterium]
MSTLSWIGGAAVVADTLELKGVLRDFKRGDLPGGHGDFNTRAHNKAGHTPGIVALRLGRDGLPVFAPQPRAMGPVGSPQSFHAWFRDVPNVNQSIDYTIKLDNKKGEPGGIYSFTENGFFPLDAQLFGNQGYPHNYGFTFQLKTTFNYLPGQKFNFSGDDDVWVYINGYLVIDLGGIHSKLDSSVLLFDGRAFLDEKCFAVHANPGSPVKRVTEDEQRDLAIKWATLVLEGDCPIKAGNLYIDLALTPTGADARAVFKGAVVEVFATRDLAKVTLKYADGMTEDFADLKVGGRAAFTGTGEHARKMIAGVEVTVVPPPGKPAEKPRYLGAKGTGGVESTLDFFFAERQCCASNFQIETSIMLTDTTITATAAEPEPVVTQVIAPVLPPAPAPVPVVAQVTVPLPPPPAAPAPTAAPPAAAVRTPQRSQWVGYVIALVLVAGAAVASLMTSRRTHQD